MEGNIVYSDKLPKGMIVEYDGLLVVGTGECETEKENKEPA